MGYSATGFVGETCIFSIECMKDIKCDICDYCEKHCECMKG